MKYVHLLYITYYFSQYYRPSFLYIYTYVHLMSLQYFITNLIIVECKALWGGAVAPTHA